MLVDVHLHELLQSNLLNFEWTVYEVKYNYSSVLYFGELGGWAEKRAGRDLQRVHSPSRNQNTDIPKRSHLYRHTHNSKGPARVNEKCIDVT